MPRELYEIRRLLRDGISQEVSARDFDVFELRQLVRAAVEGNATLYIANSNRLDTYEIRCIAGEGKQNVVFRNSVSDEEDEDDNQSFRLPRMPRLPRVPRLPSMNSGEEEEDEEEEDED
jgi:hypothetical protein